MTGGPLLLAPLRIEARALRRGAPGATIDCFGMGAVRATAAKVRIAASQPVDRPIILAGFGGALVDELCPGDLVVAESVRSIDGGALIKLPFANEIAALLAKVHERVTVAPLVSAPSIVHGAKARVAAASDGAVVVDMESLWCAPLAQQRPFGVVRAVVDTPRHELRSLATLPGVWHGYRSLISAARAIAQWIPTTVNEYPLMEVGDL